MEYRQKPIVIEAVQFTGDNWHEMYAFCGMRYIDSTRSDARVFNPIGTYLIPDLEPEATAELWVEANKSHLPIVDGEWVIRDELGFYPCKDERFRATYESNRIGGDFVYVGPEAFADKDETVISYKGDNYFRMCGYPVRDLPDGGRSHCVKRMNHQTKSHEDFDGFVINEP